jgi:hypothetical protein
MFTSVTKGVSRLRHRIGLAPELDFIYEKRSRHDVYRKWIAQLEMVDHLVTTDTDASLLTEHAGLIVFPVVDSIAQTLYGSGSRTYLHELGYSHAEADLMVQVFRNGLLHNLANRRLVFNDGTVTWAMDPISRTSGFPKAIAPGRKAFSYYSDSDGAHIAHLRLDWLVPQVRQDVESRLANDPDGEIDVIVGLRIDGRRRKADVLDEGQDPFR